MRYEEMGENCSEEECGEESDETEEKDTTKAEQGDIRCVFVMQRQNRLTICAYMSVFVQ